MYKKQVVVQKVLCLAMVIASAVIFLYSLGIMTDLYDSLYPTVGDPSKLSDVATSRKNPVRGAGVYYDMQGFNNQFLLASIGMILLCLVLFLTNTHIRRKYYIGNFIAVGLVSAGGIALTLWAHGQIEFYKSEFLTRVNFDDLKKYSDMMKTLYTKSTFWFDVHYVVFGILLLMILLLILNVIWKCNLMNAERRLLEKGKEAVA